MRHSLRLAAFTKAVTLPYYKSVEVSACQPKWLPKFFLGAQLAPKTTAMWFYLNCVIAKQVHVSLSHKLSELICLTGGRRALNFMHAA
eukprot:2706951-Amphidinium_carterae.1